MNRARPCPPSRRLRFILLIGGLLLLGLAAVPRAARAAALFPSPIQRAGDGTDALAAGDQNGDGYPDLIVGLYSQSYISVLLGNGDGSLRPPIRTFAPANALLMQDFDGDGRGDFLTARSGLVFAPSLGDGRFGAEIATAPLGILEGLAAGDFNGDGRLDVAAANRGGLYCPSGCFPFDQGDVIVVPGNGDGTFGAPIRLAAGEAPVVVLAHDLNGDGRPDLAAGDRTGGLVSVFLARGDGGFDAAAAVVVAPGLRSLAAGDFDQDGHVDIAAAYLHSDPPFAGAVAVLRGDGGGGFVPDTTLPFEAGPGQVGAGDVDGDGRTDLLVTFEEPGAPAIPVVGAFHRRADGLYEPGPRSVALGRLIAMAVADFNADGRPDVGMASQAFGNMPDIGILLTRPGGGWGPQTQFRTAAARSVSAGDVDGDGVPDLAVAVTPQTYCHAGPPYDCWTTAEGVEVFRGTGGGGVGPGMLLAAGARPEAVAAADLNADGCADLVVANAGSDDVSVLLADGAGGFGAQVRYPAGKAPAGLAVADLDGDGRVDLAVMERGGAGIQGGVSLFFGQGGGAFGPRVAIDGGPAPRSIVAADFDADDRFDLVVGQETGYGSCFLEGAGDGTFAAPIPASVGGDSLVAGYFDGDRHLDLAAAVSSSGDSVYVEYGNGDGTFSSAPHPGLPPGSGGPPAAARLGVNGGGLLATADLNHDGRADLVAADVGGSTVRVHLARPDGTLMPAVPFLAGSDTAGLAIADFDADGDPDVAAATASGAGAILLNSGSADTDGDGVADPLDDCPQRADADQADQDHDGAGDACDNCIDTANADQVDWDLDGRGDVCDPNPYGLLQEVIDLEIRFVEPLGRQRGVVSWRTTMEIDVRGFNVVTFDRDGTRISLSPVLIPCDECNTRRGASYSTFVPSHKSNRSVFVEMVHTDGRIDVFGPAGRILQPGG